MNIVAKTEVEEDALRAITVSDDILGGQPVFRGTRTPIDAVLGFFDSGMSFNQVKESFPFITEELVAAARIYAQLHPCTPSRSLGELNPGWKLIRRTIVPFKGQ